MIRMLRIVALLVLAAATLAALRYAVLLPLLCEARVTRALDALDAAADRNDVVQHAASRFVSSSLHGCGCAEPFDFKLTYAHGSAARYRGDAREAVRLYERALLLDRRPEIYLDLGMAQLDALDRDSAIASFVAAVAFDPARLERIPYRDVRNETAERIRARFGASWLP